MASAGLRGCLQCSPPQTGRFGPDREALGALQPEIWSAEENAANKPRFPRFSRTSCTFEDTARVFAVFTVPKFNLAGARDDASAVTTAKMAAMRGDDPAVAAAQDLATGGAAARRASVDYRVGGFNRLPFEYYRVDALNMAAFTANALTLRKPELSEKPEF